VSCHLLLLAAKCGSHLQRVEVDIVANKDMCSDADGGGSGASSLEHSSMDDVG